VRITERQLRHIIREELRKPDPDQDPETWREPEEDETATRSHYSKRFQPMFGDAEDSGDAYIDARRRSRFT
jgi:hypothetical protein